MMVSIESKSLVAFIPSPTALATRKLVKATLEKDYTKICTALEQGADPNAKRPCRGTPGEPLTLWLVRQGDAKGLKILLQAGAKATSAVTLGACLLVEHATRKEDPKELEKARAVVDILEKEKVNWGVSDRFIGGGLRAIDLLSNVQPEWAKAPAARLKLSPLKGQDISAPSKTRQRRS